MRYPNPLPGAVAPEFHKSLLYGNLIGGTMTRAVPGGFLTVLAPGIELAIKVANNHVVAWNTVTLGSFLAKWQRRLDFKADMYDKFVRLH
jgi:hypothetical protein